MEGPPSPSALPEGQQAAPDQLELPAGEAVAAPACGEVPAGEAPKQADADGLEAALASGPDEEDKVQTMSRQLSRLSIPDGSAAGSGAGGEPGSAGSEGAALAGLEELPPQPSPSKTNFLQVGGRRAGRGGLRGLAGTPRRCVRCWQGAASHRLRPPASRRRRASCARCRRAPSPRPSCSSAWRWRTRGRPRRRSRRASTPETSRSARCSARSGPWR